MKYLYTHIVYLPLYNLLVLITGLMPGGQVGLSIIILALLIRALLFPLTHKQFHMSAKMRSIQGELDALKERHKNDREAQARAMLALYKEHGINPASSLLGLLVQIPVIFAVYRLFSGGFEFATTGLYSFVHLPIVVDHVFLGVNLDEKSLVFALIAGALQAVQLRFALPPVSESKNSTEGGWKADFSKSLQFNMRYVLPVILVITAYQLPAALSVYWITTTIFSIVHEYIVRKKAKATLTPALS